MCQVVPQLPIKYRRSAKKTNLRLMPRRLSALSQKN